MRWTGVLLGSPQNHHRAHSIIWEKADLELHCPSLTLQEQTGCSKRDLLDGPIAGLCVVLTLGPFLGSAVHYWDGSPWCQQEKEAAHCLIPILP